MPPRSCINSPDKFCYICGQYTCVKQRKNINDFVKKSYFNYFGKEIGNQDKTWVPHKVCQSCVQFLRLWSTEKIKNLPFCVPMIWREPSNHDECYFCCCKVFGFNSTNKKSIVYPDVVSVTKPVPVSPTEGLPVVPRVEESAVPAEELYDWENNDSDHDDDSPKLYNQSSLNDLVRELNLPKDKAELLGSRFKERNLLQPEVTFSWYRHREEKFTEFFSDENSMSYCNNVQGLIEKFGIQYDPTEWRFFIDSSKRSLKGVLLNNGNNYASIPIFHSVHLKENYTNMKKVFECVQYEKHKWKLCGDLKVICMVLGQQAGYTKFPCYICHWDSRARDQHWILKDWPIRESLIPGTKNVVHDALIDKNDVLIPSLHLKLGFMKQFVKALNKEGECFLYLKKKFPGLSDAKIKEGVFVGPEIRSLMKDDNFEKTMITLEINAWQGFKKVVKGFLGNNKEENYESLVADMLEAYKQLGCNMSIKLHFLNSHLDFFPENLGDVSEEQGERFHQDIKDMERRYQGRWNSVMLADYCWNLEREDSTTPYKRKSKSRSFDQKRKRYHTRT